MNKSSWGAYRFWYRLGLFLVVFFFSGVFILSQYVQAHALPPFVRDIIMVVWVILIGVSVYKIRTFRCPRCGGPFKTQFLSQKRCIKCGLALYAEV